MSEHSLYLCKKISEIKESKLYLLYKSEERKLLNNLEYQSLINNVKNIDKKTNEYILVKKQIIEYEKQLRSYEKDLNKYLNHMVQSYNDLLAKNNIDRKLKRERICK